MKNKGFLLFGLVAFVTLFAWQSCDLVKVDSPEIDVTSEFTPIYYVKGVITTSDNSQGVEGATINIGSVSLTSGTDGSYSYKSETPFANQTVVEVIADGCVKSTSMLVFGDEAPVEYFLDFTLTRELPASMVNLTEGGEILFDGGKIKVQGGNSAVVDGITVENIEITVTPLSPFSTLGNWVGSSLKKLKIEPAGAVFEKPITIIMELPENFENTQIDLYSFNNSSNIWETLTNAVEINQGNMSFELKVLPGPIHAVNPASIVVTQNIINETPVRWSPNTCDCEGTSFWYGGYYMRQLTFVSGTGSLAELNSLHFFTDYNVPYSPGIILGIPVSPAIPYPGFTVPSCKQLDIDISRLTRELTGTYEFNGETKTFTIHYYFGVGVSGQEVDCPVWSNCHQGCS